LAFDSGDDFLLDVGMAVQKLEEPGEHHERSVTACQDEETVRIWIPIVVFELHEYSQEIRVLIGGWFS
jgi:hypothetical protein